MSGSTTAPYANANKPAVALENPLDVFQKAGQVTYLMNANKLFQAKQAAGQAALNASGPNGLDPASLTANLQADPTTAPAALETMQAGTTLNADQYKQQMTRLNYGASGFMQILADNNGAAPYAAVKSYYDRAVQDGHITAADEAKVMAGFGPDPMQNASVGRQRVMQNIQAQEAMTRGQVNPQQQDVGGNIRTIDTNPNTNRNGPGSVGTTVTRTVDPATAGSKVTWTDDKGVEQQGTYAQYAIEHGAGRTVGGAAPAPAPAPDGSVLADPSLPPGPPLTPAQQQSMAPLMPGSTAAPAQPARSGYTATQGPTPGLREEMVGSAQHAVAARERANGYQARIQPIEGALTALAGADTGKASETLNNVRASIQDLAPGMLQRMLPANLTDPAKRAAFEEANKYLTAMQINAPGGARSDAGQAAAGAATPSVHIGNLAATQVARAVLAQQRLEQAGTLAFNKTGQPGNTYDAFMNKWNTTADPRAFVADKMTAGERADLVKGMGGVNSAEYARYKQSYRDAVATDVIPKHVGQ